MQDMGTPMGNPMTQQYIYESLRSNNIFLISSYGVNIDKYRRIIICLFRIEKEEIYK